MIAVRSFFAASVRAFERDRHPVPPSRLHDLDARRAKLTQYLVGVATLTIGLIGLVSAPSEEYDGVGVLVVVVVSLTTLPVALRWFIGGWPGHAALVGYVVYADVAVTVCLLLKLDLLTAIGGTVLFAVVTTFAVITVPSLVCSIHIAVSVVVLVIVAARAALNDAASGWVVAAHALTMLLMFSAPLILIIYVSELRSRARQSLVDPLTGLRNRRGLFTAVDAIVLTAPKNGSIVMSAVVMDVDGMKGVNDTHGHHTGDAVLLDLTQHLRALASNDWVVARLGGDEFACVTVGEPVTTEQRSDRLVTALSDVQMISGLSVSVGSATTRVHEGGSEQAVLSLLKTADAEMYRVKVDRRSRRDLRDTAG